MKRYRRIELAGGVVTLGSVPFAYAAAFMLFKGGPDADVYFSAWFAAFAAMLITGSWLMGGAEHD